MLSRAQQGNYRPIVARAWSRCCAETGADPADKLAYDQWYRRQLMDAGGWYTSKEVRSAADYKRLMLHFAALVNDEAWLLYLANAEERNIKWLIGRELVALGRLTRQTVGWNYARGILRHMHIEGEIDDVPAATLHKVFVALNTHTRRLRARSGKSDRRVSSRAA